MNATNIVDLSVIKGGPTEDSMLDIKSIENKINEMRKARKEINKTVIDEIEKTQMYLDELRDMYVCECGECEREITYSEWEKFDGECENCSERY